MDDRIQVLETRLSQVERSNRRLRWSLFSVPLLAVLAGAQAVTPVPKRIVAEEFLLVDSQGKTRAALSQSKDGASLSLQDKNGKIRAMFSADLGEQVPRIVLSTKNEKLALVAGQSKDNGIGYLEFHDEGTFKAGFGGNAIK